MSTPVVELRDAAVVISGRPILRHVDLVVENGDWLAVMGGNGSGKSTLIRGMLGLWPLASGEARLFDTPLGRFRDWHRVGYVPQRPGAASGVPASVREVVTSGLLARRRPFLPLGRDGRWAVDRAIETVGLSGKADDGISTLSGGQQQRALIARALAVDPDLLVLDEPTAGVDLPHQEALADALSRLGDRGLTVILVAHELGPMADLVDRTVVMRDGRTAYDGRPLTNTEVFSLDHDHHHGGPRHHDHAPHIESPLDGSGEGEPS